MKRFEERAITQQVVEIRGVPGKLKVFGAWYLWQTLHGFIWELVLALTLCSYVSCTESYKASLTASRIVLGCFSAGIQMHIVMKMRAHKRWMDKHKPAS